MKTQISQFPASLHKPYSGVYQQQGRMITDADWNAQSEVHKARLDAALRDVVGSGTPEAGGIVAGTEDDGYTLVWGDVYVDGIRGEVAQDPDAAPTTEFDFGEQEDFPAAPALPGGAYRLYLDVWERSLTALEEEALVEAALHGADTSTRTRTMAQVKWCPTTFQPEDADENPPIGEGRLTLTLRSGLASGDPCEPCLDEIEVADRLGNYAFRVEVHAVTRNSSGAPTGMVLKWSRENGAEAARIAEEPPGFRASDWLYEFYHSAAEDSVSESHAGYHHPAVIAGGFTPRQGTLVAGYPDTAPPGFSLVRRWDGYVELEKTGATWAPVTDLVDGEPIIRGIDRGQQLSTGLAATAHGHVAPGATLLMSLDTLSLSIELAEHQYLAGDYWIGVVREAIHENGDVILDDATPDGILHHYMCLADIDGDTVTLLSKDACKRFQFPPLTNLHAGDVCYDNSACEMPGVGNVQEALDHLCQQRDLRWHNKHLHGWGIVCGLIVECCPDKDRDGEVDNLPEDAPPHDPRECVMVTKGYAINCEGEDIVLNGPHHVDLIEDIKAHDEANPTAPILSEGKGTACLSIALDGGRPVVKIEPHDGKSKSFIDQILDGTLLGEFIQHCVLDMIKALSDELSFLEDGQATDADGDVLVSQNRRKFISFWNLIAQFVWKNNGPYVWMSRREYDILRALYLRLIDILGSKTFCALFADDRFPPYAFEDTRIDTWFGADQHTKVKADPTGQRVYTYGGADANIHVYDVEKGELVEVIKMNAAEGAEVTAIAFTADGRRMYAAASVKGADTILGIAQVGDKHVFERPMQILCDILIPEMHVAPDDADLIYAVGLGEGLFLLRPDVLAAEEKPKPEPAFAFNAHGAMVIDPVSKRAFATASTASTSSGKQGDAGVSPFYDRVAVCPLGEGTGEAPPTITLFDLSGNGRSGSDDLAILPGRNSRQPTRLYVVADGVQGGDEKDILTIDVSAGASPDPVPVSQIAVEDTQIALATDAENDVLYASFEDSFRLQAIARNGVDVIEPRIPVQLQPTDVTVGPKGDVYTVNFLSSTVTAIPRDEVQLSKDRLMPLADMRFRILLAFYALVGNLFQYLKDCFCHHLLIKCPECDGSEIIYLACVEVRDGQVYNICNFGKRKYVQTFMAWNWWLSIIPIIPMMKQAIAKMCCTVLPNFLDRFVDDIVAPPPPPNLGASKGQSGPIRAKTSRGAVTAYKRTDFNTIRRQQTGKLTIYRDFAADMTILPNARPFLSRTGLRKESLRNAGTDETLRELERAGVTDVEVRTYDPSQADRYALEFARTSSRIDPEARLIVYERDGKTAFIAEEKAPILRAITTVTPEEEARLAAIEARAAALRDSSATREELASLETRKAEVAADLVKLQGDLDTLSEARAAEEVRLANAGDTQAARAELVALEIQKAALTADLTEIRSGIDGLREARIAEETEIARLRETRTALSSDLQGLTKGLAEVSEAQKKLRIEIDSSRPVSELEGITAEDATLLSNSGIRTIGDLANASTTDLTRARVGTATTDRRALITSAKKRLE